MSAQLESPYPSVNLASPSVPSDGFELATPKFCKRQFLRDDRCTKFYQSLSTVPDDFYACPFGFSCYKFTYQGQWAWTSLIPFPRLGSPGERERAKEEPASKVAQDVVLHHLKLLTYFERRLSESYDKRIKDAPPAFHELRKLNRAIKQGAERLRADHPADELIRKVHAASELLSNQFDILELLATEEILKSAPTHFKQIEAVIYKCAKVLEERAGLKRMEIIYELDPGSAKIHPKSFPIIASVLIDNAIRYGKENTKIVLKLNWYADKYRFVVENHCDIWLPKEKLFLRGSRLLSTDTDGSGLGLYLVKQIATQHGGKVLFEQANGVVRFGVEAPFHN